MKTARCALYVLLTVSSALGCGCASHSRPQTMGASAQAGSAGTATGPQSPSLAGAGGRRDAVDAGSHTNGVSMAPDAGTSPSTGPAAGGGGVAPEAGSGGTAAAGGGAGAGSMSMKPRTGCGADDPDLPAEPSMPDVCMTLSATRHVDDGALPDEAQLDTSMLQGALSACAAGQAVKLVASGTQQAFLTGPLTLPAGVTLWVDAGVTLFGTRDLKQYGQASALITVSGDGSGIVGDGVIDGQGGEPIVGQTQSFWDQNGNGGDSPALIQVRGATHFTLYRITLHNAPKFHVKLGANGFVVWGVTIKTPSRAKNSAGSALTPSVAHNTDGIDPGEAASNGFIVCSKISVGDDQIAIKGGDGVENLIIAHNHFGAGHGMSIGSEFQGGIKHVKVYDLSIDGKDTGLKGGSSNGIRIKSDPSRGGVVSDVSYTDICVRQLTNPIILTPKYSTNTGNDIPQYKEILIKNFHALDGSGSKVTLDGYGADYVNSVTLDNVVIDGMAAGSVTASYTDVTLGPGKVSFMPSGTGVHVDNRVMGDSQPNSCANKWVSF